MKKVIAMVLALVLSLSVAVADVLSPNGATAGMSESEVIALEGRSPDYENDYIWGFTPRQLAYQNISVSKYNDAMHAYSFADGKLFSVMVTITDYNDADVGEYMNKAMTQVYGQPTELTNREYAEFSSYLLFNSG